MQLEQLEQLKQLIIPLVLIILSGSLGAASFSISATPFSHKIRLPFQSKTVEMGCCGDILIGIAASLGVLFFANSLFNIKVANIKESENYVKLISISVIAGYAGIRLLTVLSSRMIDEVKDQVKSQEKRLDLQEQELKTIKTKTPGLYKANLSLVTEEPQIALEIFDEILIESPDDIEALIGKAKALKRRNDEGDLENALKIIEDILKNKLPDPEKNSKSKYYKARCLYNRACYKNLLGYEQEEVIEDLKKAFKETPQFKKLARKDPDLETINLKKIIDSTGDIIDNLE